MSASENDMVAGPLTPANGVTVISLDFFFESNDQLQVFQGADPLPLTLGVDYTVTGAGSGSGVLTLTVPADGTDAYSVFYVPQIARTSDLPLRGDFQSAPVNAELDRITRALQFLRSQISRALRVSPTSPIVGPLFSQNEAARAGRAVIFDATGESLEIGPTAGDIAGAQANAAVATAAAAAAALDADAAEAAAASLTTELAKFPSLVGNGLRYVRVNLAELAFEFRTAVQAIIDLGVWTAATGSARLPVGTTAQRDAVPAVGMIRFNSELGRYEGYAADATWKPIGGGGLFKGEGGTVGGSAGDIFRVNEQELNANVTIDGTENAQASGPLSIASGITLTISTGGNLVLT